ncbi:winged helix-turn-helix transcriptional regulator [Paraburkholderia fynbosensis]|nr:helix-turn-helix domain-containing protein [Paraburkholderia fynbosensis]
MLAQEGTISKPGEQKDPAVCEHLSRMLARICDKWTLLVVRTLGRGPRRFNALRRDVGEISQKMLTQTLKELEENGLVKRTVTPVTPPQVEYALTDLGDDFLRPVRTLAEWVAANSDRITAARSSYAELRVND